MLVELKLDECAPVTALVSPERVPARAVLSGLTPGRVFANDRRQPSAVLIWGEFRYCYLAGDSGDGAFVADLASLLAGELLPEARASSDPTIVFYPLGPGWLERIAALFPGDQQIRPVRQRFTFDPARFAGRNWQTRVPAGLRVERIAGDRAAAVVTPLVGVLWRSVADFLTHGMGYCVVEGDRIASTCLSAFVAGGRAEISIDTDPDYREQGLATLCGAAFIAHCLDEGITPVWECWRDNVPSVRLAARLGFRTADEQATHFVDLTGPADA